MSEETISAAVSNGRTVAVRLIGDGSDELSAVALSDRVFNLNDAMEDVASLAATVRHHLGRVAPKRATVEIGIGFSVSAGRLTALVVNAGADARLWSIETCRELGRVKHHITGLRSRPYYFMTKVSFSFSPAGRFLATATAESARVWSLDTEDEWLNVKHRFRNPIVFHDILQAPYSIAFSREKLRLAVVRGPILSVWEVETKEEICRVRLPSSLNWFTTAAISLDGKYVLTGGATVALWDGSSGELLTQMHVDSTVTSMACTPAADYAMFADKSGEVRVVSTANWGELARWQCSPVPVSANLFNGQAGPYGVASPCVAIDSLGRLAAIGGGDGTVRVINLLSMLI